MLDVKAGLESWFDETMSRAEGAYKRWTSLVLLLVGLVFAFVGNASTSDVARDLWQNSATRSAVAEAASNVGEARTPHPQVNVDRRQKVGSDEFTGNLGCR